MPGRFRAFLIHLTLTAILLTALLWPVIRVWYPAPYFEILGAGRSVWISVALVFGLGPLLTLVVFKAGKRGLKFDLVVIAITQLAALLYGGYQLYERRPLYMVFAVDRFNILVSGDVDPAATRGGPFEPKILSGPRLLVATLPPGQEERERLIVETLLQGKPDVERRPRYWSEYADDYPAVLAVARPLLKLRQQRPAHAADIDRLAARGGRPASELLFHGVSGVGADYAVALDPADGAIIAAVAVDPWLE